MSEWWKRNRQWNIALFLSSQTNCATALIVAHSGAREPFFSALKSSGGNSFSVRVAVVWDFSVALFREKRGPADRREEARIMPRDFLLLPYPALPLSFSVCSATSVSAPTESMSEIYVRTAPQKLTRAFSHYKKAFK